MNVNDLFANGYTGNIAVTGDVVTVKGDKETIEYTKGATVKDENGIDQVTAVPAFTYKTDKGKVTRITAAE